MAKFSNSAISPQAADLMNTDLMVTLDADDTTTLEDSYSSRRRRKLAEIGIISASPINRSLAFVSATFATHVMVTRS